MFFIKPEVRIARAVKKRQTCVLIAFLKNPNQSVVLKAIEGLGQISKDAAACRTLIPYLHHQDVPVRLAAVQALVSLGNPDAQPYLSFRLKNEKNDRVIAALHEAIVRLESHES